MKYSKMDRRRRQRKKKARAFPDNWHDGPIRTVIIEPPSIWLIDWPKDGVLYFNFEEIPLR